MKHLFKYFLAILLAAAVIMFWGRNRLEPDSEEALKFVKSMGSGINIGNSLDAFGVENYKEDPTAFDYEIHWNNPQISKEFLQAVRNTGIRTVRLPVTWGNHMDSSGKVDREWMDRVSEVVRMALDLEFFVILDAHHEEWFDLTRTDRERILKEMESLWKQIAVEFQDCGDHLLFEGMNEPRCRESSLEWTDGTPELRSFLNKLNKTFVDTVRSCGKNNAKRYLLIPTYANKIGEELFRELEIPDKRIIVSLHTYEPQSFCRSNGEETSWRRDDKSAKKIRSSFELISKYFIEKKIPVIITEFGCVDKDNLHDRVRWTEYFTSAADANDVMYIWWDNGSAYKLFDRTTGKQLFPEIIEALVWKVYLSGILH